MSQWVNKSLSVEHALVFTLDYSTTSICMYILFSAVCQAFNVFGLATNIINIIIFAKQGFKDSINVSLLGMPLA